MAEVEELEQNAPERLREFEEQLASVEAMLLDDPENEELLEIHADLTEVIELTREVCHAAPQAAEQEQQPGEREQHELLAGPAAAVAPAAAGAAPSISSLLPPQVAEQIRHAQQRAALAGQGLPEWAIGAKCRALYSGDNNWYNAVVLGVGASGGFLVQFDGYDAPEEVGKEAIELRPAEDEGGYKPVAAPKRRRVDDSAEVQEVPKWLQVKEGDDEKTKAKKRKLAKSYKSKARFAKLDQRSKQKADDWKRFMAGKGKKKAKK